MVNQSLLPKSNLKDINIMNTRANKTWIIRKNRIIGIGDGLDAIKQTITMMLSVPRYEYLIYSWDYGHELNNLIGKDVEYAKIEIPRLIKECLLQDDRISGVNNFTFTNTDKGLLVEFNVTTIDGIVESEVTI